MTTTTTSLLDQMLRYSPEETRAFFDSQTRKLLGLSSAEFLRRLHAGTLTPASDEQRDVIAYLTRLSEAGACAEVEAEPQDVELATPPEDGMVIELSPEESRVWFDEQARARLGISGMEFLRRWDAGEYDALFDTVGHDDVTYLGIMANFGR